jgi:hypothetical protein
MLSFIQHHRAIFASWNTCLEPEGREEGVRRVYLRGLLCALDIVEGAEELARDEGVIEGPFPDLEDPRHVAQNAGWAEYVVPVALEDLVLQSAHRSAQSKLSGLEMQGNSAKTQQR